MATYADLHMHTTCSDGVDNPKALLGRARSKGLSAVSITDHDTMAAYDSCRVVADELGLELITGIEVSTFYKDASVHVLGYFIDTESHAMKKLVVANTTGREERMEKMLHRLAGLGYKVEMEKLKTYVAGRTLGRVTLAGYLVELGYCKNTGEAFEKLIGDGKPGYEPVRRLEPHDAIELIAAAGGVSSVAHPGNGLWENDIKAFVEAGLDAVEAMTPYHSANDTRRWLEMADRLDLAVTGGSDCHGPLWRNHDVGATGLDSAGLEELKARKKTSACGETTAGGQYNETA